MISHSKKFVFVGIPKTGTTSIEKVLARYCYPTTEDRHSPYWKHRSAAEIKANFEEEGRDWSEYFVFTFVRNPFDRMLSLYKFMDLTISNWETWGKPRGDTPVFMDWIDLCYEVKAKSPTFERYILNYASQEDFHEDDYFHYTNDGSTILVDFVGKLESLQSDFDKVCEILDIPQFRLPHTNKTSHQHYTQVYTQEMRAILETKLASNLKAFGYSYDT